jgi:hypothetical protein
MIYARLDTGHTVTPEKKKHSKYHSESTFTVIKSYFKRPEVFVALRDALSIEDGTYHFAKF